MTPGRTHPAPPQALLNIPLVGISHVIIHLVRRSVKHDMHVLIAANAHAAAFHHGSAIAAAILVSLLLLGLHQPRLAAAAALVRRQQRSGRARRGRRGAAAADPRELDRAVDAGDGAVVELDAVEEFLGRFAVFEGDFGRGVGGVDVGEFADAL